MTPRTTIILAAAALGLAGGTVETLDTYQPVTDRPDARYAADLTACRAIATAAKADCRKRQADALVANLIVGAISGAVIGNAVGGNSDWTAYGAASGAASGVAVTDTELVHGGPRRILDRCLVGRGHIVLSDVGRG